MQTFSLDKNQIYGLAGKVVGIVGASGFIGSHLLDALLELGCYVRAISRSFPGLIPNDSATNPNLSVYYADLTDKESLSKALCGVEVLIHLASGCIPQESNEFPVYDIQTNLIGSLNLLESSVEHKIQRFVFVSSGGTVYGSPVRVPIAEDHPTNPTCSYGITKLAIEKYILLYNKLYGLDGITLRLANPYGPRQRIDLAQGVVPAFLSRAIRGESLTVWGDGSVVRDFLYIKDAIESILLACTYSGEISTFNIGSGEGLSLNHLISLIQDIVGSKLDVVYKEPRLFDVPTNVLAIDSAKKVLNWIPTIPPNEGIKKFYDYLIGN